MDTDRTRTPRPPYLLDTDRTNGPWPTRLLDTDRTRPLAAYRTRLPPRSPDVIGHGGLPQLSRPIIHPLSHQHNHPRPTSRAALNASPHPPRDPPRTPSRPVSPSPMARTRSSASSCVERLRPSRRAVARDPQRPHARRFRRRACCRHVELTRGRWPPRSLSSPGHRWLDQQLAISRLSQFSPGRVADWRARIRMSPEIVSKLRGWRPNVGEKVGAEFQKSGPHIQKSFAPLLKVTWNNSRDFRRTLEVGRRSATAARSEFGGRPSRVAARTRSSGASCRWSPCCATTIGGGRRPAAGGRPALGADPIVPYSAISTISIILVPVRCNDVGHRRRAIVEQDPRVSRDHNVANSGLRDGDRRREDEHVRRLQVGRPGVRQRSSTGQRARHVRRPHAGVAGVERAADMFVGLPAPPWPAP